jgi:hypothetical protein
MKALDNGPLLFFDKIKGHSIKVVSNVVEAVRGSVRPYLLLLSISTTDLSKLASIPSLRKQLTMLQ